MKKFGIFMLSGLLVLGSLTSVQAKENAIQIGDVGLSREAFLSYLRISQMENYGYYYDNYGSDSEIFNGFWSSEMETSSKEYVDDNLKELSVIDVVTYGDDFKDTLIRTLSRMMLEAGQAKEYGVSLSKSDEGKIESAVNSFIDKNSGKGLKKSGITKEGLVEYLKLYTLSAKVEDKMSDDVEIDDSIDNFLQSSVYVMSISASDFSRVEDENIEETTEAEGTEAEDTEAEGVEESITYSETEADIALEATTEEEAEEADYLEIAKNTAFDIIKELKSDSEVTYEDLRNVCSKYDEYAYPYEAYYGSGYNIYELPDEVINVAATLKDGEVCDEPIEVPNEESYYIIMKKSEIDEKASSSLRDMAVNEKLQEEYEKKLNEMYDKNKGSIKIDAEYIKKISISDDVIYRAYYDSGTEKVSEKESEYVEEETYKIGEMTEVG